MKTNEKNKLLSKASVFSIVVLVVLIIETMLLLGLLTWGFITSFKDNSLDFRINPIGFPKKVIFQNFIDVWESFSYEVGTDSGARRQVYVPEMFLNAFLYAFGCAFTGTLIPCITSYACARYKYKFSGFMRTLVIVIMALPIVGNQPAEIRMARAFGFYDQIWGLWIMRANFLGMYFLVFYATFRAFPASYSEAAKIDGASNWTIMVRIMLPLIRNTFFTVMLINFISFWNLYDIPLIYLPRHPTIALGLYFMMHSNGQKISNTPARMSAAMMMLIPILIVFLFMQKRLLGSLTVGGVKG